MTWKIKPQQVSVLDDETRIEFLKTFHIITDGVRVTTTQQLVDYVNELELDIREMNAEDMAVTKYIKVLEQRLDDKEAGDEI